MHFFIIFWLIHSYINFIFDISVFSMLHKPQFDYCFIIFDFLCFVFWLSINISFSCSNLFLFSLKFPITIFHKHELLVWLFIDFFFIFMIGICFIFFPGVVFKLSLLVCIAHVPLSSFAGVLFGFDIFAHGCCFSLLLVAFYANGFVSKAPFLFLVLQLVYLVCGFWWNWNPRFHSKRVWFVKWMESNAVTILQIPWLMDL